MRQIDPYKNKRKKHIAMKQCLRLKMRYVIPASSDGDNTPHYLVPPIIKNRHPSSTTATAATTGVLSEPLVLW